MRSNAPTLRMISNFYRSSGAASMMYRIEIVEDSIQLIQLIH